MSVYRAWLVLLFVALTLVFIGGAVQSLNPHEVTPCMHEDSLSCHWDSAMQGNGEGQSFDVDQYGNVTYN